MTQSGFTITVYDGSVDQEILADAIALYREIYAEPPYLEGEDDFASFADDLPKRAKRESFRLVVARLGAEALGFALGHQLPTSSSWWEGALTPLHLDFTTEYPGRTFAIIELAARRMYRRHGLGRRLHAHLTVDLSEDRRTLLVRPDAEAAQAAYASWGYHKVGQVRPFLDGPIYDALVAEES